MSALLLDWAAAADAGSAHAGGKGWRLGVLAGFGVPVPPGFVIAAGAMAERRPGEPLPAALVQALAGELSRRGWSDRPLAVRSSAAAEDSAGASFAGIHRSCLNVCGMDALVIAVREVLDSAHEPAALAYRQRLGLGDPAGAMAVVVMPLLPAVASGVAFTLDPTSGREDQVLIHANWGLGEALVGGQVDADEFRFEPQFPRQGWSLVAQRTGSKLRMTVARSDGGTEVQDTPGDRARRPVLTAAQAMALCERVYEVAVALDYASPHCDVEWVWDGDAFWIVQARPVTARGERRYPALADQPLLWSRGNARDVVPDPFPALDWSLSRPMVNHMLTRSAALAGYPLLPGVRRSALLQGRLYYETSVLQWEAFDGFDVAPKPFNRMLGGHQPEIRVPPTTRVQQLIRGWRGMRFLLRIVGPRLRATSTLQRAHGAARQRLAATLPGDIRELTAQLRARIDEVRDAEPLMLLQVSGSALLVLIDLLERHFPGEGGALASALLSGGEPSVTAAQTTDLMRLAAIAAADPPARAWLQSSERIGNQWQRELLQASPFRQAFADFLQRYGHRGVYESYLHRPRWHEQPDYLLDTIAGLIGCDDQRHRERQRSTRAATQARIRQSLPIALRTLLAWLTRLAQQERNIREAARSALIAHSAVIRRLVVRLGERLFGPQDLPRAVDVFHLTLDELLAVGEGALAVAAASQRAAWRRRQFATFQQRSAPEVLAELPGGAATGPVQGRFPDAVAGSEQWDGLVVAAGYAEGIAHVAHHPDDTLNMPAGAILVAPATDPSWTPAFVKAAAIVMETGGYLSHGAIVAREFGIPAVVNLPGILAALRSGDRLAVDAHHGRVRRTAPRVNPVAEAGAAQTG
jgi:pyruvate,water dikinase